MVTEETLKNFLEKKSEIVKLCGKNYMTNLRLIIPGMPENKDRVHLLVDEEEEKVDMLDSLRVENGIAELIKCPAFVVSEEEIHEILKADMLHYPIPIEDDEAIKQRFTVELIPFSQDPRLELPLLSKPEPKAQHSATFSPKLSGAKQAFVTFNSGKEQEVSSPDDQNGKTNGDFYSPYRTP